MTKKKLKKLEEMTVKELVDLGGDLDQKIKAQTKELDAVKQLLIEESDKTKAGAFMGYQYVVTLTPNDKLVIPIRTFYHFMEKTGGVVWNCLSVALTEARKQYGNARVEALGEKVPQKPKVSFKPV